MTETVKKKVGRPRKKAAPKAQSKAEVSKPSLSENPVTRDEIASMISEAVGQATKALAVEIQKMKQPEIMDLGRTDDATIQAHDEARDGLAIESTPATEGDDEPKRHGPKVVEAKPINNHVPSAEEVANWTPEQIAEFNANEVRKQAARKRQQEQNRSKFDHMSAADRMREYMKQRDPNVIRKMDNFDGEREIECTAIRKVGLGADGTSDVGETIILPVSVAKKLQESGAIRVNL